jgi:hypothetical protein
MVWYRNSFFIVIWDSSRGRSSENSKECRLKKTQVSRSFSFLVVRSCVLRFELDKMENSVEKNQITPSSERPQILVPRRENISNRAGRIAFYYPADLPGRETSRRMDGIHHTRREVSPHLPLSLSTWYRVIFPNALSNLAASSRIGNKFQTYAELTAHAYHPPQFIALVSDPPPATGWKIARWGFENRSILA